MVYRFEAAKITKKNNLRIILFLCTQSLHSLINSMLWHELILLDEIKIQINKDMYPFLYEIIIITRRSNKLQ